MTTGLDELDHLTLPVLRGLCDDAAIFPPGSLPLDRAVPAHLAHRAAAYSDLVGPLVVGMKGLPALAATTAGLPDASLDVAVTLPSPAHTTDALALVAAVPAARLVALEVAVPDCLHTAAVVPMLAEALTEHPDLTIHVEVPRGERRDELFAELAGSPYLAKLRTGGVRADLYPSEGELAGAIAAAVLHGVPFKATAGLHHAVRNTDPTTGFEQHGFLNLVAATDAALRGSGVDRIAAVLALRDGAELATLVRAAGPRTREVFRSFGTCSITEPVAELAGLGLLGDELLGEAP
ncbi:MAG TPA: hypothetical protein VGE43_03715 [Acidimicrobiales bacterium]